MLIEPGVIKQLLGTFCGIIVAGPRMIICNVDECGGKELVRARNGTVRVEGRVVIIRIRTFKSLAVALAHV